MSTKPIRQSSRDLLEKQQRPSLDYILKQSITGKDLLEIKENLTPLNQKELVHTVVEFFIRTKQRMTLLDMASLAEEITKIFPSEISETYFVTRQKGKRNPTGKLYDRYQNVRFKTSQNKASSTKSLLDASDLLNLSSEASTSDDEMEDIKLWVKNNFEPWDDIKANWIKS